MFNSGRTVKLAALSTVLLFPFMAIAQAQVRMNNAGRRAGRSRPLHHLSKRLDHGDGCELFDLHYQVGEET